MLLCVMRALLNLSTGGNAYTPSPYIQEHTDTCTQTPMSKQVTDIRANVCMHALMHTHTSKLLEDTSVPGTSLCEQGGEAEGSSLPLRGPRGTHLVCDATSGCIREC